VCVLAVEVDVEGSRRLARVAEGDSAPRTGLAARAAGYRKRAARGGVPDLAGDEERLRALGAEPVVLDA